MLMLLPMPWSYHMRYNAWAHAKQLAAEMNLVSCVDEGEP